MSFSVCSTADSSGLIDYTIREAGESADLFSIHPSRCEGARGAVAEIPSSSAAHQQQQRHQYRFTTEDGEDYACDADDYLPYDCDSSHDTINANHQQQYFTNSGGRQLNGCSADASAHNNTINHTTVAASSPSPASLYQPPSQASLSPLLHVEAGKHFGAVKPWSGNMQPPDNWNPATLNPKAPDVTLALDFVYGYRARQAHNNLHWVDERRILYHSAGVCVLSNLATRTQTYFTGHDDDVLCLDYHAGTGIAASGGLGKRNTAPIMLWRVEDMSLKVKIVGTLEFGVVGVAFSADGSRVFGVGSDNSHSVACFDTSTGVCLASMSGDKQRIVHIVTDTTFGRDSKRNFITVGVSHIKFWQKLKNKEEFEGKKAIGGDISKQTMVSACCTLHHVLVGNVSGKIYVFTDGTLSRTIAAHASFVGSLTTDSHNTVFSGGRDGLIKVWNFENPDGVVTDTIDLNPYSACTAAPVVVDGKTKRRGNGARAISCCPKTRRLLVGTQFGCIYTLGGSANTTATKGHSNKNGEEDGGANPIYSEVYTVLESHFEEAADTMPELWGLDIHPREPLFCTSGEDATMRLWSLDLGSMIIMANIGYASRACAFSPCGGMIAVGHENGAFSVWDSMTLTPTVPFTRKRPNGVISIAYSPDGRFLAMSMARANVIDVYDAVRGYTFVGTCNVGSSNITHIDWGCYSNLIQCSTSSYDLIVFNIPSGTRNVAPELCNEMWASHSSVIGWGVQGIWEDCSDGTDINSCGRSNNMQYLVCGYDSCRLRMFNYPALPRFAPQFPNKPVFPAHREYKGHSSHVTKVRWSADDRYLLTIGGMDLTVLRWKVVPVAKAQPSLEGTLNGGLAPATANSNSVADDVARGRIRELPATTASARPPTATGGGYGGGGDYLPPTENIPPSAKNVSRKPYSSNAHVQSRLLQSTASADSKARSGRAQREHIIRSQSAMGRFQK